MNSTIANTTFDRLFRRLRLCYIATAGALTLAAWFVVGFDHDAPPATSLHPAPNVVTTHASSTRIGDADVYYIVSSEEQRDATLAETESSEPGQARTYYLIAGSFHDEGDRNSFESELSELRRKAYVIDLRNH